MSNKAKRKKRVGKRLDRFAMTYLMHFGERQDFDNLSCFDCSDLKSGVCPGRGFVSDQCLECMEGKVLQNVEEWGPLGKG